MNDEANDMGKSLGLKSQFWGGIQSGFSAQVEEDLYSYLDKLIKYTKRDMTGEQKQKILKEAKEVICWKLMTNKRSLRGFCFRGFLLEGVRGCVKVEPLALFVEDNILYALSYIYGPVKFSYRLNYESFTMIYNIIEDEGIAIAPSREVMLYIKEKQGENNP